MSTPDGLEDGRRTRYPSQPPAERADAQPRL